MAWASILPQLPGCRPPYYGGGCWQPRPYFPGQNWHGNLPDQNVGPRWRGCSPFFPQQNNNGFVIDQNNNGRYDRGRDGVLVFDMNRDGRYDQRDVSGTNDMMKAATGNYDFNNDGCVSFGERLRGAGLSNRYRQLDRNHDGRLETWEIQNGGGKVWVDKSRGGGISRNELYSPYNVPGNWWQGNQRVDSVSPWGGTWTSNNGNWWNRPCPGPFY